MAETIEGLRAEVRQLQNSIQVISGELGALHTVCLAQGALIDELFGDFALPLAETLKLKRDAAEREHRPAVAAFIERFLDDLSQSFDIPAND